MPTRFLLAKRVPTRKGRGHRGASSRPAGACARGRGGPGQRSRRSRFHRLHRCRGDTCGRVRRPSRGTAELNAPGKPVGAMESAPCPLRSGTPRRPSACPTRGGSRPHVPAPEGPGLFAPAAAGLRTRCTNERGGSPGRLDGGDSGKGQPAGTALSAGASRFPGRGFLRGVKGPGGAAGRGAAGPAAPHGARLCPRRLAPRSATAAEPPSGARSGERPGSGGLGKGRGCRGRRGGGGGRGVASQVPLLEERALLQMSSGPRSRARRVSATYGGWI